MANNKKEEMAVQAMTVQDVVSTSMRDVFNRASQATISGVENIEKKDGTLVPKKEYTFINPIGKRTTMTTYDKEVIASTEKIAMALYGKTVLNFAICREMAKLNNQIKLEAMGFSTIAEYGKALFDFSRTTAQQYARIGEVFIDDDYKLKSNILPASLQKGHLIELLAYVGEDGDISAIEELYLDGTLTDGMATTKLRATLKEWKNGTLAIDVDGEEVPEIEEKGEKETEGKKDEKSANSEKSNTEAKEVGFDIQKEVGKILSACNEITEAFDNMNKHSFSVGGYEKALDTLRALANGMLA